jgi:RND family efflux transporter MFP subunit
MKMRGGGTASGYLAAIGLLALAACSPGEGSPNQTVEGALVEVVEVQPQLSAGAVRASGMVGYKREPQLAFATPGVIAAIEVDAGDVVRRGQRLATLRRTSVGSNADEAALASANAERDLQRTQELFERGFVSQARLDDVRLAAERARASSVLTAPANGVILRRSAEVSQTVGAGAPIFIFGDTASGFVVRAPVASVQAARIQTGDAAQVRIAGQPPREGRVTRVGAKGAEGTGAFEVEIEIASADGLRSGTVADVDIAASGADVAAPAILVPTLSLLDARADQGMVFVVDAEGVARRRAVRTAGVTQEGVLVIEGLGPGDRVIAAGAAYVRDGESVRIGAGS